jgi:hypothetical protein
MHSFSEDVLGRGEISPGDRTLAGVRLEDASLRAALLVTSAFVGFAWLSWRRLGSLIIDGGHELDVPRRILGGAVLYRDFSWNWGPLAPWVNSVLYRLFGVHSDTLMWAGLVSAALACLGLYLLARCFVGPLIAAWVGVAFLASCAFSRRIDHAIFNFVLPFNFSATYGITLAIWSVLLLVHHVRSRRTATLTASAVLAGLVALTKMETTFAVMVAHATFLATLRRRPSRAQVLAWGCGAAVAAVGYGFASWASEGKVWTSLVELFNTGSRFYIGDSMGVRHAGHSLLGIGLSFLGWAAILTTGRWLARTDPRGRDRRLVALAWAVVLLVPAVIVERTFFRAVPFLLAACLVSIVVLRLRHGESALAGEWRELLVVGSFALAALPRILLRTGLDHYGFYLIPPTLACVAIAITRMPPARGKPPLSPRILGGVASTVLAGVALGAFITSVPQLTKQVIEIRTTRVHRLVDAQGPEATLIPYLSTLPPGTVCAAIPDGAGLIFASGLTPPDDGMLAYIPMHLPTREIERRVLGAWKHHPPEVIIRWTEDQRSVFGYAGFGQDYGLELAGWISARYEVAKQSPHSGSSLLVPRHGG